MGTRRRAAAAGREGQPGLAGTSRGHPDPAPAPGAKEAAGSAGQKGLRLDWRPALWRRLRPLTPCSPRLGSSRARGLCHVLLCGRRGQEMVVPGLPGREPRVREVGGWAPAAQLASGRGWQPLPWRHSCLLVEQMPREPSLCPTLYPRSPHPCAHPITSQTNRSNASLYQTGEQVGSWDRAQSQEGRARQPLRRCPGRRACPHVPCARPGSFQKHRAELAESLTQEWEGGVCVRQKGRLGRLVGSPRPPQHLDLGSTGEGCGPPPPVAQAGCSPGQGGSRQVPGFQGQRQLRDNSLISALVSTRPCLQVTASA